MFFAGLNLIFFKSKGGHFFQGKPPRVPLLPRHDDAAAVIVVSLKVCYLEKAGWHWEFFTCAKAEIAKRIMASNFKLFMLCFLHFVVADSKLETDFCCCFCTNDLNGTYFLIS